MSDAPGVLKAFAEKTGGRRPAGTLIGTGLVSPEGRVEIMLTAGK
jgi:enamine deaminase RidA (YjgF/YER057c/UK114 family)